MKKVFKVLTLFVTIATLALLSACTKDNAKKILGTWNFVHVDIVMTADDPEVQEFVDEFLGAMVDEMNNELSGFVFDFKADNTVVITYTDVETHQTESETAQYSVDGDIITFDGDEMTIKTLTNNSLVLVVSDTFDEDGITGTVVETLEFKR